MKNILLLFITLISLTSYSKVDVHDLHVTIFKDNYWNEYNISFSQEIIFERYNEIAPQKGASYFFHNLLSYDNSSYTDQDAFKNLNKCEVFFSGFYTCTQHDYGHTKRNCEYTQNQNILDYIQVKSKFSRDDVIYNTGIDEINNSCYRWVSADELNYNYVISRELTIKEIQKESISVSETKTHCNISVKNIGVYNQAEKMFDLLSSTYDQSNYNDGLEWRHVDHIGDFLVYHLDEDKTIYSGPEDFTLSYYKGDYEVSQNKTCRELFAKSKLF